MENFLKTQSPITALDREYSATRLSIAAGNIYHHTNRGPRHKLEIPFTLSLIGSGHPTPPTTPSLELESENRYPEAIYIPSTLEEKFIQQVPLETTRLLGTEILILLSRSIINQYYIPSSLGEV